MNPVIFIYLFIVVILGAPVGTILIDWLKETIMIGTSKVLIGLIIHFVIAISMLRAYEIEYKIEEN